MAYVKRENGNIIAFTSHLNEQLGTTELIDLENQDVKDFLRKAEGLDVN